VIIMNDPSQGIVDAETALRREVEFMTDRFPQVPPSELESLIRRTYAELKNNAAVESHLLAVTREQVTDLLHQQGVQSHLRDVDLDAQHAA
jgi:hypothetical protein